jgi:hypothetical protein
MTVSTESTPNVPQPLQITPVIIKSGGGGPLSETGSSDAIPADVANPVTLYSPIVQLTDKTGTSWNSAEFLSRARLLEVTIVDGDLPLLDSDVPRSLIHLASLTISFGQDQLILREEGIPEIDDLHLVVDSPQVPFTVVESTKGWELSGATFPNNISTVVLTLGDDVLLDYTCTSADVTLGVTVSRI